VIIETKYDIGQNIYMLHHEQQTIKCTYCNGDIGKKYAWIIWDTRIRDIKINSSGIKYYTMTAEANAYINENDIIDDKNNPEIKYKYHFTTRELAQAECDRRNKGGALK